MPIPMESSPMQFGGADIPLQARNQQIETQTPRMLDRSQVASGTPLEANPRIAMAGVAPQPVDINSEALRQLKIAEEQQNTADNMKDKSVFQDYLSQGGDLYTPDGIKTALKELKGKISVNGYSNMAKAAQSSELNEIKIRDSLANLSESELKLAKSKQEDLVSSLAAPLSVYKKAIESGKSEEEARSAFEAAKKATILMLGQQTTESGKPMYPPQSLQQFQSIDPETLDQMVSYSSYGLKLMKETTDIKYKQAQTRAAEMGKEAVQLQSIEDIYGKDSPEYKAALQKMSGSKGVQFAQQDWESLSEDQKSAARTAAWNRILTGHEPPARGGLYQAAQHEIAAIAKENGMSTEELLTASADVKTRIQAKSQIERRIQNLERAENQLQLEIPVMKDAMSKLDLPSIPIAARGKISILRQMGNPEVAKLDQAAEAILNEFNGIVTGNPGTLNVQDVLNAKEQYKNIQTPQQMQAWIEGANRIIANAKKANEKTREDTMSGIRKAVGAKTIEEKNNPGNIRPKSGEGFQKYETPEAGIEAIDKNLQAYNKKHGLNTIRGIVSRWAPPNENDTNAYIADVARRTGWSPDQQLNMDDPTVRHVLASMIMLHEQGSKKLAGGVSKKPQTQTSKKLTLDDYLSSKGF